jgi:hypothetical protein
MKGIDPKWVFYIGIAVVIEQGLGQGTVSLTNVVPADWVPYIKGWCTLLAFIGSTVMTALAGYSSNATGPLINLPVPPVPPAVKAALTIFAALLTSLIFALPAHAQTKSQAAPIKPLIELNGPCAPIDSRPQCQQQGSAAPGATESPEQVWKQIVTAATADLTYAEALADNAATPNSKLRSNCYAALITANQQANGVNLKDGAGNPLTTPDPAIITKAEQGLELIDNLQPSSPLVVACAPAANAVRIGVLAFINTVVTGAALKAATAGILP